SLLRLFDARDRLSELTRFGMSSRQHREIFPVSVVRRFAGLVGVKDRFRAVAICLVRTSRIDERQKIVRLDVVCVYPSRLAKIAEDRLPIPLWAVLHSDRSSHAISNRILLVEVDRRRV